MIGAEFVRRGKAKIVASWANTTDPAPAAARAWIAALPAWWPYAAIAAMCFLIRLPTFGNPELEFDEQLYLLVGDRMLHGQLPFVDMWDRKPIGLFAFFAAIRLLGGTGVIQYQIVATVCVAITCGFLFAIARRRVALGPALFVSLSYVLFLNVLSGTGGQASVLYNALTACAAWAAFRANDTRSPARIVRLALLAMALEGIAIQFKYTPVVEGMFFGCWFLLRLWRCGLGPARIAGAALAMIALAVLPTALAIGYYAAIGHLDALVQANFISVFHRNPFPAKTRWNQLLFVSIKPICLLAAAPFAMIAQWRACPPDRRDDAWLIGLWTVFALIGFGMLGDFYDFYFITALLPLCILVAPLLRPGRIGFGLACMMVLWPALLTPKYYWRTAVYQRETDRLVQTIKPYVGNRCLYIYDGPAVFYLLTGACAPTRFLYPDHLTNPTEAPALGVDPVAEEARVLATRPGAIMTADRPLIPRVNPATQALVRAALARDYVLVDRAWINDRMIYVWVLKSLHPGPAPISDPHAAWPQ